MSRSRAARSRETATPKAASRPALGAWPAVLILLAVACLAYANAWPDALIFDDKPFRDYERFTDWTELPRYFTENVWAARGLESNLYRPLLLVSITLDAHLYRDWFAGYHITNIVLHALVTVFVFALAARILAADPRMRSSSVLAAFLAALVFAVHPVNTEVVNSVFNRSTLLAALGMTAGLWWLLRYLESKPLWAWAGLFLAYTCALFCRETAIVLPGIAAGLVLVYTEGHWRLRIRKALPVLVLLIPMVFYLAVRSHALSDRAPGAAPAETEISSIVEQVDPSRVLQGKVLLEVAGVWTEALRVVLWPHPLQVSRPGLSRNTKWIGFVLHLGLVGFAVFQFRRGHNGLLVGLAFFYIALLPSSRLFGASGQTPHLNERYLYEPLIGLALLAAYGFSYLTRRADRLLAAALAVLCLTILTPLTWARNAEWKDEIRLFESDYATGKPTTYLLRLLTAAHLREGNFARVLEVCEANRRAVENSGLLSSHCASGYSYSGRHDEAVQAYLAAAEFKSTRRLAHWNLAQHYMRQQRPDDARIQFDLAVEAERDPARKAFYKGYSMVMLHPKTPAKWADALPFLAEAVRLDPRFGEARKVLEEIRAALGE